MRRLLAVVLLVLLPVQFSWAAVASYCAHEAGSAGHFGHHEHHHPADATPGAEPGSEADAAGLAAPGTLDADCGHCHGTCSVMPLVPQVWPGLPAAPLPSAAGNAACSGHAPARPERPQWLCLA